MTLEMAFPRTLKRLFPEGAPAALVAVSGGVDSMVLLDLARRSGLRIAACHVDHGQREEARLDGQLVADYCRAHGVPLHVARLDLPSGSSENTLRKARYEALRKLKGRGDSVYLLAHHADDQLETLLFRLLRGANPATIRGILPRSRRGELLLARPLLAHAKQELLDYARRNAVPWREDVSNASPRFARNRIRQELIPLLESLRPKSARRLLRFFTDLRTVQPPADSEAARKIAARLRRGRGIASTRLQFLTLKKGLDRLLGEHGGRTTRAQWDSLAAQLRLRQATKRGGGPRKRIQFPGGYAVFFEGNQLFWRRG